MNAASGSGGLKDPLPTPKKHYSGLWIGEARPDPSLPDVPVNPIKWSLSLLTPEGGGGSGAVSAFGAGFFDDSGDIPGMQILHYTINGKFDVESGGVSLKKQYVSRLVPEDLVVKYEGKLTIGEDGQPQITGQWFNDHEHAFGVFGCHLEEQ
mmetsp:Transcript_38834/g.99210  ORF Transcript_38834/g.99210 Transcript_38834/m.99210 type:complete len:152 (-) Transcript_38834:21-476(-)|eukprot:CAMPEP_0174915192 /NCGR_PEP_ID=MMETSP1355-20121228/648_1 /TAXON_ID=464990 /ORGANISM="Hemiselmis tepida, Strain CCMP443" /LENGTH=151 /DNA_ID=CAMNT_0016160041 /DNA_START=39 /DNA_END=494 /DNA_ORIENTATION=-